MLFRRSLLNLFHFHFTSTSYVRVSSRWDIRTSPVVFHIVFRPLSLAFYNSLVSMLRRRSCFVLFCFFLFFFLSKMDWMAVEWPDLQWLGGRGIHVHYSLDRTFVSRLRQDEIYFTGKFNREIPKAYARPSLVVSSKISHEQLDLKIILTSGFGSSGIFHR